MKDMEKNFGKVVTIDGPAGGGKSTVARLLAKKLDFEYLDTGGMYRAAALAGLRCGVNWDDPNELANLVRTVKIQAISGRTLLDGEDVSDEIRTSAVTELTHFAADNPQIRAFMTELQRQTAIGRNLVTEGRDQGTVVFPDAFCKFYLTATPRQRALRRLRDLEKQGEKPDFSNLLAQLLERDRRDAARKVGPLCCPPDALRVETDEKTVEQVVVELENAVRARE